MNELSSRGMLFTDAHTTVCTPSRYELMTGRHNWCSWLKRVLTGEAPSLIEKDRSKLASLLKSAVYYTYFLGKWHLGLGWQTKNGEIFPEGHEDWSGKSHNLIDYTKAVTQGPNDLGFDYSYIIPASLDLPPYVYLENGKATGIPGEWNTFGVRKSDFKIS